jgi:hypothetical protein
LPLIHEVLGVVVCVINQYPSLLIRPVDVVRNAAGRRELFTEHDHVPVRNCIFEKSGFGFMGIGVVSILGAWASATPNVRRRAPVRTAHLNNRMATS